MDGKNKRWSEAVVTDVGTELLTEFAAGRLLKITSAYGSVSGEEEDLTKLTELPDGRSHPLTIESVTRTDESVTACIQVTSLGNPAPYKLDWIGLFAQALDPETPEPGGEDKLLMVIADTEDEQGRKGVTVPAESEQLYVFKLYAVLTVTNKERLEISVSSAGIATLGAIDTAIDDHNQDPEAHPGMIDAAMAEHNTDSEAHPALTARIRGIEVSINGSETLTGHGDPTSETEGKKGQHYINLDSGDEFVCTDDAEGVYTWEKFDDKKSMRKALEDVQSLAASAKEVADGAAEAIAAVQNTISVVPSQSGSLTYNKDQQKPSWNNYSKEMMTVTYGQEKTSEEDFQGETNAGTYKAYFKPKGDYTWSDKSTDEREVEWTIGRATIATVPSVSGTLTYTGSPQAPVWKDFSEEQLSKAESEQTDAGPYSTTFTPQANYQWSGGDTAGKSVSWSIEKAANTLSIDPSSAQDIKVGGQVEIHATTNSDANITAETSSQTFATISVDAGEKKVTVTGAGQGAADITVHSKGSKNYTDASKVLRVNVTRNTPSFSISPSEKQTITIGGSKKITVTTDSDGKVAASSNPPSVATATVEEKTVTISGATEGSTNVTISVPQTVKYNAANAVLEVAVEKPSVAKSSWDDIAAISAAGTAASYFAPGDTKSIVLNGTVGTLELKNLTIDVFVLGINHNADKEGANRIHWALGKIGGSLVGLCDAKYNSGSTDGTKCFNMNHWGNYNYGGWKACDLRYDILGSTNKQPSDYGSSPQTNRVGYDPDDSYDIVNSPVAKTLMAALPEDLRKVMKTVTKYSDNKGNHSSSSQGAAGDVTTSKDYIVLLSEFEVHGTRQYANEYEQNYQLQYDYFKASNPKIAHRHDSTGTVVWWFGRSAHYSTGIYFTTTNTDGSRTSNYANYSSALVAGFFT